MNEDLLTTIDNNFYDILKVFALCELIAFFFLAISLKVWCAKTKKPIRTKQFVIRQAIEALSFLVFTLVTTLMLYVIL